MTSRRRTIVNLMVAPAIVAGLHVGGEATGLDGPARDSMAAAGQSSPLKTFTLGVERVRVDVSVRQGGRAVSGLTAGDFEVLDNGVRQQVDLVGLEEAAVNVVLALDMSGSVQGSRLTQLRTAGSRLVTTLEPRDSAALVVFTELVTIRSGFTADQNSLRSALEQPAAGADTALVDAAHAAMVLGQSKVGRPLVIIFSDGADTASFLSPALVLDAARRMDSVVYAVTTTAGERGDFLDELVRLTGGRRLGVGSLDRLGDAFAEILRESRERYLLSYTPTGVPDAPWHELTVRVRGSRADVRARPGYLQVK